MAFGVTRALAASATFAFACATGCEEHHDSQAMPLPQVVPTPPPVLPAERATTAGASGAGDAGAGASGCEVTVPVYPPTREVGNAEALIDTSAGLFVLATAGWWNERASGPLELPTTSRSAVRTTGGFLWIAEPVLARADADMSAARRVRPLPDRACEPHLIGTDDGALLIYRGVAAGSCSEPRGESRAFVQHLDPRGEFVGAAVALGGTDAARRPSSGIAVRRDAGRIVVAMDDAEDRSTALVLDGAGRELGFVDGATVDGGEIACARAGCLRIAMSTDASGRSPGGGFARLRCNDLGGQTTFEVEAPEGQLDALSVRGDHVLVRIWLNAGERNHAIAVLNVVDGRLESLIDRESGQRSAHVTLRGTTPGSVATTTRGFVVSGVDPTAGAYTREIRCRE